MFVKKYFGTFLMKMSTCYATLYPSFRIREIRHYVSFIKVKAIRKVEASTEVTKISTMKLLINS
jgi:hypothetical protein